MNTTADPTTVTAFAPGRVNLIGEHTDYNDGLALAFAIRAGVSITATRISGPEVRVTALELHAHDHFRLSAPAASTGWRAIVRGAVAELQAAGVALPATRIEFGGTLPPGQGLSASAALALGVCLALCALAGGPPLEPVALAKLAQRIEHRWLGAQTGLLDQLTCLCGSAESAVLIDFQTLAVTPVSLPLAAHQLVALASGEEHQNANSGYNDRRKECLEAASRMRVRSLREASIQDLHMLPDGLARRARHVITENLRVQQALDALRDRDLTELGRLLDRSHASLREDFEISTPAVEATVAALKAHGALGARLLGAGFGGSVLGLLPPGVSPPEGATVVMPGPGAHVVGR